MATAVLKGFSPDVFNRLYVTHNKNLEPNVELVIFLFSKVTLKATAVNSDSWREAYSLQLDPPEPMVVNSDS